MMLIWHFRVRPLQSRHAQDRRINPSLLQTDLPPVSVKSSIRTEVRARWPEAIERSEGAVRKWLRGQSEPNVTDLRAICEVTGTSVEWLVMGRGPRGRRAGGGFRPGGAKALGARAELPPLNYKLMDDVVRSIRAAKARSCWATKSPPEKQSSVLTTVYNMSRRTRHRGCGRGAPGSSASRPDAVIAPVSWTIDRAPYRARILRPRRRMEIEVQRMTGCRVQPLATASFRRAPARLRSGRRCGHERPARNAGSLPRHPH